MKNEAIFVSHISKKIKKNVVLDDVTFTLEENKIMGLVGINGSGKTMLLRAIAGLINTDGEIRVGGQAVGNGKFARDMGILIETPAFLDDFTGEENLELLGLIQGRVNPMAIKEALKAVGLKPDDKRTFKKYSLGMKERLGIAQAILGKPRFILLDEPTNGIDQEGLALIKELVLSLKKAGCTLIIASHDKEFLAGVADVTYEMRGGKLQCR